MVWRMIFRGDEGCRGRCPEKIVADLYEISKAGHLTFGTNRILLQATARRPGGVGQTTIESKQEN